MNKIEILTKKQIELMGIVRQEWLDKLFKRTITFNEKKARRGVEWLYELSKLKKPVILFVDSPYAAQIAQSYYRKLISVLKRRGIIKGSEVRREVESEVWSEVGREVESEVGSEVESEVWSEVWSEVGSEVWSEVWREVGSEVWSEVWREVGREVESEVGREVGREVESEVESEVEREVWSEVWSEVGREVESEVGREVEREVGSEVKPFSTYGNIWDYGWSSFYDFWERINPAIFKKKSLDNLHKFRELLNSGIYDMIQLEGLCVVCKLPQKITRGIDSGFTDERLTTRMHNPTGYAIEWADGYGQNYLYGIYFDNKLFKKVTKKGAKLKDILGLKNTEQRTAALKLHGAGLLLEHKDTTLIHKSDRGNELYKVEKVFRTTRYMVKCIDPQNGEAVVLHIPAQVAEETMNADACNAWTQYLTIDQYNGKEYSES